MILISISPCLSASTIFDMQAQPTHVHAANGVGFVSLVVSHQLQNDPRTFVQQIPEQLLMWFTHEVPIHRSPISAARPVVNTQCDMHVSMRR